MALPSLSALSLTKQSLPDAKGRYDYTEEEEVGDAKAGIAAYERRKTEEAEAARKEREERERKEREAREAREAKERRDRGIKTKYISVIGPAIKELQSLVNEGLTAYDPLTNPLSPDEATEYRDRLKKVEEIFKNAMKIPDLLAELMEDAESHKRDAAETIRELNIYIPGIEKALAKQVAEYKRDKNKEVEDAKNTAREANARAKRLQGEVDTAARTLEGLEADLNTARGEALAKAEAVATIGTLNSSVATLRGQLATEKQAVKNCKDDLEKANQNVQTHKGATGTAKEDARQAALAAAKAATEAKEAAAATERRLKGQIRELEAAKGTQAARAKAAEDKVTVVEKARDYALTSLEALRDEKTAADEAATEANRAYQEQLGKAQEAGQDLEAEREAKKAETKRANGAQKRVEELQSEINADNAEDERLAKERRKLEGELATEKAAKKGEMARANASEKSEKGLLADIKADKEMDERLATKRRELEGELEMEKAAKEREEKRAKAAEGRERGLRSDIEADDRQDAVEAKKRRGLAKQTLEEAETEYRVLKTEVSKREEAYTEEAKKESALLQKFSDLNAASHAAAGAFSEYLKWLQARSAEKVCLPLAGCGRKTAQPREWDERLIKLENLAGDIERAIPAAGQAQVDYWKFMIALKEMEVALKYTKQQAAAAKLRVDKLKGLPAAKPKALPTAKAKPKA